MSAKIVLVCFLHGGCARIANLSGVLPQSGDCAHCPYLSGVLPGDIVGSVRCYARTGWGDYNRAAPGLARRSGAVDRAGQEDSSPVLDRMDAFLLAPCQARTGVACDKAVRHRIAGPSHMGVNHHSGVVDDRRTADSPGVEMMVCGSCDPWELKANRWENTGPGLRDKADLVAGAARREYCLCRARDNRGAAGVHRFPTHGLPMLG